MKNIFRYLFFVVILLIAVWNTNAQSFNALPWSMNTAYFNYLMRDVHAQYKDRSEHLNASFASEESMLAYRDECISKYKSILGDFPEKGDLNPQILGSAKYDGFSVEKIIYQSLPDRFVTANFYIPEGDGPFPAILMVCGHGLRGKIPGPASAILFAKNGIAVLVVDPVGQGERIQFIDENSQSKTRGATTGHTLQNMGANLIGSSVAAYEFWDNHRGIDYLMTRKDVDPNRLGAYGSSGGGTQTSYLMGLDDRLKVASVCSYFSSRERTLEMQGPSDGCQHVPYEGREQLEVADFVLMMAPKPVLIMSGKYDFVDYWGALQAFEELEKTYTALGAPEKVKMFSIEGGHGMPQEKREALVTWFKQWLLDDATPVKEKELVSVAESDLQCTETGQVNSSIKENTSIPDYHLELAKSMQQQRKDFVNGRSQTVKNKVKELLGIEIPDEEVVVQPTGTIEKRNYNLQKFTLVRDGQMPVPCVLLIPETINDELPLNIYLNDGGKSRILGDETELDGMVNSGQMVLFADLRGFGELADPPTFNNTKYWNWEYRNAMISMHIGRPIMGQRVIDIFTILDFVENDKQLKGKKVKIVANGKYGPAVVHAAYLDKRIQNAEISRSVKSFVEFLENPMQRDVYTNVLYGVLKYYDLPDLVKLSGSGRVRFVD